MKVSVPGLEAVSPELMKVSIPGLEAISPESFCQLGPVLLSVISILPSFSLFFLK